MRIKAKKKSTIDGALDAAWSRLVKERAKWKCEYCGVGTRRQLQSHHIYSRANKSVRWHLPNGICLCASHHVLSSKFSAHQTPVEFTEWLYKTKGEEFMTKLRLKASWVSKLHLFEKKIILQEMEKEIAANDAKQKAVIEKRKLKAKKDEKRINKKPG